MCGICGVYAYTGDSPPVDAAALTAVRDGMEQRGPDGSGTWISADRRVGLGHRRLAIIDIGESGAQPMATLDGRYRIVFNGEIFNFKDLRRDLAAAGYSMRSQSDTEVLLYLYAHLGPGMVACLRGMFAFAIWDDVRKGLFLARDGFGIKPLYFSDRNGTFRFASQVRALLRDPMVDADPDPAGQVGFFVWGSVPEPHTLYRHIRALPAGGTLWVSPRGAEVSSFFSVRDEIVAAEAEGPLGVADAAAGLRQTLVESVSRHLISDVPLGVFLSAGLDSGLVTALAAGEVGQRLRTLTLGFSQYLGTENDETGLAAQVAETYGSQHETRWLEQVDFEECRHSFRHAMDQPSVDGLNLYLVSQAAASAGLTVALSGLGGDEMFGGYPSFTDIPKAVSLLTRLGTPEWLGRAARRASAPLCAGLARPKYAGVLEYGRTFAGAYLLRRGLFMPWELGSQMEPELARVGWDELHTLECLGETVRGIRSAELRVSALELCWYTRNQLLRDTDWASMAHSIEVRVPFLDIDVFRAMLRARRAGADTSKTSIAAVARPPLPAEALLRRKTGFVVPMRRWAQGPQAAPDRGLRIWARQAYDAYESRRRCDA